MIGILAYWSAVVLMTAAGICGIFYTFWDKRPRRLAAAHAKGREICWVFAGALALRLLLLVAGVAYMWFLEGREALPSLEAVYSRWDAPHYLWIAQNGYQAVTPDSDGYLFIVFFPLYPYLVGLLGGSAWAGILLSCLMGSGASAILYALTRRQGGTLLQGAMAALFLQLFPMSVFLHAPYTEGMFLFFTAAGLFCVDKKNYLLAGVCGFFAALTRNVGVLLVVPCAVQILLDWKKDGISKTVQNALWCLLIPLGTLVYLGINRAVYGDPFMFMKIQKAHWSTGFGFFASTVRYITQNFFSYTGGTKWYLWGAEMIAAFAALLSLPLLMKKMTPAQRAYSFVYLWVILSPAWLLSFPRYLMGMASLYPALAKSLFPEKASLRFVHIAGFTLLAVFAFWMLLLGAAYIRGEMVL